MKYPSLTISKAVSLVEDVHLVRVQSGKVKTMPFEENRMKAKFTLEYWQDHGWYVGRLREVPGVFSQGETLKDLEENILNAYSLVMKDQASPRKRAHTKSILVPA